MRRASWILAVAIGLSALLAADPAGAFAAPVGSTSGGDPYFPAAGNGGYDVMHYDLALDSTPATRALSGTATIFATATASLSSFSLDLRDLTVSSVTVNGRSARFAQADGELVISPRSMLTRGRPFVVQVVYGGTTGQPEDSTGALYGWVSFDDGAFVANEPEGASTWYPVNDVPYDKATYSFTLTVPDGHHGGRQRRPAEHDHAQGTDHLPLGRPGADGQLPVDGGQRQLHADARRGPRRACASSTPSTTT